VSLWYVSGIGEWWFVIAIALDFENERTNGTTAD
jgi:hypothetical protein